MFHFNVMCKLHMTSLVEWVTGALWVKNQHTEEGHSVPKELYFVGALLIYLFDYVRLFYGFSYVF